MMVLDSMQIKQRCCFLLLVIFGLLASTSVEVSAQEPGTPDSLVLQQILRRLDSLENVIKELRRSNAPADAQLSDLAALRAAAAAAAQEAAPDAPDEDQQSRTRNLGILNPEISVTGDVVGSFTAPNGGSNQFSATPREFEFSFQAALDPYTRTKVFVTREEDFAIAGAVEEEEEEAGGFEIEEGYMYWVGLPGGFGAKVGKFRQELGLYNRWHTHALFEVERPLATTTFLGEDGLIQTGASVVAPSFTVGPATQTLTLEATRANNDALFDGGSEIAFLGRFQNFWDLGSDAHLQLGVSGLTGDNDEAQVESRMLGVDLAFRWAPGGQQSNRDIQLKGEWIFAERETPVSVSEGSGGYIQLNYKVDPRWTIGARADVVDPYGIEPDIFQFVPSVTWWQSEWVRIRLQYNYLKFDGSDGNHTLLLQFVWAMGPDKHETY